MNTEKMLRYKSHKEVHALKISGTTTAKLGVVTLHFRKHDPIDVDPAIVARHWPEAGDYFVVYPDGYQSISPAKAFEDGYTLASA